MSQIADRFLLILGCAAGAVFLVRCLDPSVFNDEENLMKMVEMQPALELLIIAVCLWIAVPGLFRKIKSKTLYDLIYITCFFIACGILVFLFPSYIPADASIEDKDLYMQLLVYAMLGAFLLSYAAWEGHKRKIARKSMDKIRAEGDEAHERAMRDQEEYDEKKCEDD